MPEITLDLTLFATAFVTVLVIMDPIGNIPIFLSLTKGQDVPARRRSALLASTVAASSSSPSPWAANRCSSSWASRSRRSRSRVGCCCW